MKFLKNLSRRNFFQNTWLLPAAASSAAAAAPPRNLKTASVYQRLAVRTFINAVGTLTTRGGTLMPPEVKAAMEDASTNFVMLHELQEKVGARLAELSGAEDAFVTAGASCSLCLATCAVTAGDDKRKMRQLPDLTGMKSEIVIQTPHRSSFDHAFSMVGVKLVNVDTEPDIPEAINENTAALAFVLSHNSMGHKVSLERYLELSHKHNLRGPQCSGILMGKREWIRKAYANAAPNNYLARMSIGNRFLSRGVVPTTRLQKRDELESLEGRFWRWRGRKRRGEGRSV